MPNSGARLQALSETDLTVAEPAADVRGRTVLDRDSEEIGEVDDLLIDDVDARVRMLNVKHGGFLGIGSEHFLVPVDAVTEVTPDHVRIDRERSRLTDVPGYDPNVARQPDYYSDVYGWWGYGPYWAAGYGYPPYPY